MATVRFNLRPNQFIEPSIQLVYRLDADRKKIVIGTGLHVPTQYWNEKTMRVREVLDFKDAHFHNIILNAWETSVTEVDKNFKTAKKTPTLQQFRKAALAHMKSTEPLNDSNGLLAFFKSFISSKMSSGTTDATIKQYNNALNHLKGYITKKHNSKKIDLLDVDLEFLQGFNQYLRTLKKPLVDNTINKIHKRLVAVLNKAAAKGLKINPAFRDKDWKVQYTRQPKIYLTKDEVESIRKLDLPDEGRLDKVRDNFLIGLACGLRYSDLKRLSMDMIVEKSGKKYINKLLQKGSNWVLVPVGKEVMSIIDKYDGFPPSISLDKFNQYLQELCELAGIDSPVYKVENGTQVAYKKYQLVASHICRRSFATNGFKAGVPVSLLKDITGHSTVKQFLEYVQVNEEESALMLSSHEFFS